jgi:hypothetical protein
MSIKPENQDQKVYFIADDNGIFTVKRGTLKRVLSGDEIKHAIKWQGFDYEIPDSWIFETSLEALAALNEINYLKQVEKKEKKEVIQNYETQNWNEFKKKHPTILETKSFIDRFREQTVYVRDGQLLSMRSRHLRISSVEINYVLLNYHKLKRCEIAQELNISPHRVDRIIRMLVKQNKLILKRKRN